MRKTKVVVKEHTVKRYTRYVDAAKKPKKK